MIIDSTLEFDVAVALTATRVSTNVLDLKQTYDSLSGDSSDLFVKVSTPTPLVGAGTLQVDVQTATDAAMTTPIVIASRTFPNAQAVAGGGLKPINLSPGALRYLRLNYTVAGGNFSAGTVSASVGLESYQDNSIGPSGFTVA